MDDQKVPVIKVIKASNSQRKQMLRFIKNNRSKIRLTLFGLLIAASQVVSAHVDKVLELTESGVLLGLPEP